LNVEAIIFQEDDLALQAITVLVNDSIHSAENKENIYWSKQLEIQKYSCLDVRIFFDQSLLDDDHHTHFGSLGHLWQPL
jgi:hypothetical protein